MRQLWSIISSTVTWTLAGSIIVFLLSSLLRVCRMVFWESWHRQLFIGRLHSVFTHCAVNREPDWNEGDLFSMLAGLLILPTSLVWWVATGHRPFPAYTLTGTTLTVFLLLTLRWLRAGRRQWAPSRASELSQYPNLSDEDGIYRFARLTPVVLVRAVASPANETIRPQCIDALLKENAASPKALRDALTEWLARWRSPEECFTYRVLLAPELGVMCNSFPADIVVPALLVSLAAESYLPQPPPQFSPVVSQRCLEWLEELDQKNSHDVPEDLCWIIACGFTETRHSSFLHLLDSQNRFVASTLSHALAMMGDTRGVKGVVISALYRAEREGDVQKLFGRYTERALSASAHPDVKLQVFSIFDDFLPILLDELALASSYADRTSMSLLLSFAGVAQGVPGVVQAISHVSRDAVTIEAAMEAAKYYLKALSVVARIECREQKWVGNDTSLRFLAVSPSCVRSFVDEFPVTDGGARRFFSYALCFCGKPQGAHVVMQDLLLEASSAPAIRGRSAAESSIACQALATLSSAGGVGFTMQDMNDFVEAMHVLVKNVTVASGSGHGTDDGMWKWVDRVDSQTGLTALSRLCQSTSPSVSYMLQIVTNLRDIEVPLSWAWSGGGHEASGGSMEHCSLEERRAMAREALISRRVGPYDPNTDHANKLLQATA